MQRPAVRPAPAPAPTATIELEEWARPIRGERYFVEHVRPQQNPSEDLPDDLRHPAQLEEAAEGPYREYEENGPGDEWKRDARHRARPGAGGFEGPVGGVRGTGSERKTSRTSLTGALVVVGMGLWRSYKKPQLRIKHLK